MKKVIIAPSYFHKDLLNKLRLEDPFCDVKILSKGSLIGEWLGKVEPKVYLYLIKELGFSYDSAKAIIPFLPYASEKVPSLFEIKNKLIDNHLLIKNEYLKTFFLDKKVEIYGYSNHDKELLSLLNHFQLNYQFISLSKSNPAGNIVLYDSAFDEVFYTLNEIGN